MISSNTVFLEASPSKEDRKAEMAARNERRRQELAARKQNKAKGGAMKLAAVKKDPFD